MFAALSQYESRFKSLENITQANALILRNLMKKLVTLNHKIDHIQQNLQFVLNAIPDSDLEEEKKEC